MKDSLFMSLFRFIYMSGVVLAVTVWISTLLAIALFVAGLGVR